MIICKECQYAVLPSHIDAHFAAKPQHGLGKRERQRIADEIVEIDGLIGNKETLRRCEFQFPPPTSKPIAALGKPNKKGMRCTIEVAGMPCFYVCCSIQQMQEHSWEEHKWKSDNKGGRPRKRSSRTKEVP
jgi:hypothetical protein